MSLTATFSDDPTLDRHLDRETTTTSRSRSSVKLDGGVKVHVAVKHNGGVKVNDIVEVNQTIVDVSSFTDWQPLRLRQDLCHLEVEALSLRLVRRDFGVAREVVVVPQLDAVHAGVEYNSRR